MIVSPTTKTVSSSDLERLALHAAGDLDAPRLAERILHDAGDVVEALDVALLLDDVGEDLLAVDRDRLPGPQR